MDREKMNWIVAETREWFTHKAGYESEDDWKAVVGISGGKDSSVVAALLCKAIGKEKVYGILMPNGEQKDIQDSKDLCVLLGIRSMTVDIENPLDSLMFEIQHWEGRDCTEMYGFGQDPKVTTNLPARMRMCVEYAVANHINARVIGTGNKSEDLIGWATLWGDTACDYQPLADLWVDEVVALGQSLGLPDRFTKKPPADGMCGKTDEEAMGFTYAEEKIAWQYPRQDAIKALGEDKYEMISNRFKQAEFKRLIVSSIPCPGNRRD